MRDFHRGGNRGGGGRSFGKRDFGGNRSFGDRKPRQMYDAVCDNCGKACQVPFQPTGEKPVYCRDCFEKMNGGAPRQDRNDRPSYSPAQGVTKEDVKMLNEKLDKILSLLETASEEE